MNLSAFHKANAQRAKLWPDTMLGTSTHDTKRGEDVRARLAVLSEIPGEWANQVNTWSRLLRARRGDIGAAAPPDRNDEYLLYQLMVGSWPVDLMKSEAPDPEGLAAYAQRLKAAMVKSVREAKINSRWEAPNTAYEDAMLAFIDDALNPERSQSFFAAFLPFQQRLARLGIDNSLIQTTLKLSVPGVPDFYQGSELWDLSLVDPDNRRPVDYTRRIAMLENLAETKPAVADLYEHWEDGAIKLFLTSRLLDLRRQYPELFARGDYEPLSVNGSEENRVCAFARNYLGERLLVAVARFPARPVLPADLSGITLSVPLSPPGANVRGRWRNILADCEISTIAGRLLCSDVFRQLPVAVLMPAAADDPAQP